MSRPSWNLLLGVAFAWSLYVGHPRDQELLAKVDELATGHLVGCCEVTIALDGGIAVIGATDGIAYVFARTPDGWVREATLEPSDIALANGSGVSVAVSGETVLAGVSTGTAYVFDRTGGVWSETTKLQPPIEPERGFGSFGTSVALDDDVAVVGVSGRSAYVFVRADSTWQFQAELALEDDVGVRGGGQAVAVSDDVALIGATDGSARIFMRRGGDWIQTDRLVADESARPDRGAFGSTVALEGDIALVGDYYADVDETPRQGAVHVFSRQGDSWQHDTTLVSTDGAQGDLFGSSVDLDGDAAVVGAQSKDRTGSAYVFTRAAGRWTERQRVTPEDSRIDWFGGSVAGSQGDVLVSAIWSRSKSTWDRTVQGHVFESMPESQAGR